MVTLMSCYKNPYYDAAKEHHTQEGFINTPPTPKKSWKDVLKWRKERQSGSLKKPDFPENSPFLISEPDPRIFTKDPVLTSVTWLGHSSVLLQIQGLHILTDPHLTLRASPFSFIGPKRYTAPPISIDALPQIDYIVISHDHYDHLDVSTLKKMTQKQKDAPPHILVPLGYKKLLASKGLTHVTEFDWWDKKTFGPVEIHCTPVQHWSRRSLTDYNHRLWSGWAVASKDFKFFFSGDTGYTHWFKKIGDTLGPFDASAIPIGAYAPRWFMKDAHMNVEDAIKAHTDLQSLFSFGIHWGTFILTDEPLSQPRERLNALMKEKAQVDLKPFLTFKHGQTKVFAP